MNGERDNMGDEAMYKHRRGRSGCACQTGPLGLLLYIHPSMLMLLLQYSELKA